MGKAAGKAASICGWSSRFSTTAPALLRSREGDQNGRRLRGNEIHVVELCKYFLLKNQSSGTNFTYCQSGSQVDAVRVRNWSRTELDVIVLPLLGVTPHSYFLY